MENHSGLKGLNHQGLISLVYKGYMYINSREKTYITLLSNPNTFPDMAKSRFNTTDGSHLGGHLGFPARLPLLICLPCFKLTLRLHRTTE